MKHLWKLSSVIVLVALVISLFGFSATVSARNDDQKITSSDRLLVKFEQGVKLKDASVIHEQMGVKLEKVIPRIKVHVVSVPGGQGISKMKAYRQHGKVRSVEIDCIAQAIGDPNDPYFYNQWGMSKVKAPEAWGITQGSSSVSVAILDTGVDFDHPDLSTKVISSANFTSSPTADANGHSHGTHVAGIAAADTNNSIGIAGLGYNTSLMNVKVLGDDGYGYYSWIANGIIWATDNGADVINLSLGATAYSSTLKAAVDYAWDSGVVVVAAAGNNGSSSPFYPAYFTNCVAVAATGSSDQLYSWSSYGEWVDVAAPGSAYSTIPENGYGYKSGTSMASPHVAGLAGLLFSVTNDENGNGRVNDEVRTRIETTCDEVDIAVSYGRINAYQAVQSSPPNYGEVSGVVTDAETGLAICGATVTNSLTSDTTGSDGGYHLAAVPPGIYALTASAESYVSSLQEVTVSTGETSIADFSLLTLNDAPIMDPIGDKIGTEGQLLQFTVSASDPDGDVLTYQAANLPDGAVFDPDFQAFTWTPAAGQAGTYPGIHFDVSDGQLEDYENITIIVEDVVLTGQIGGMVTDAESGLPIAGASVSDGTWSAITGSDGTYIIVDVPEGVCNVTATAPGYESSSHTDVAVNAGQTTEVNFALKKEAATNTMWIESIKFQPAGKQLKNIFEVVNPEPVSSAEVTIDLYLDGTKIASFTGSTKRSGTVTFVIRNAESGQYTATVVKLEHNQYIWDTGKGVTSKSYLCTR
ncbi:S8 family serine peptidase [Chloroflexota bacterium]